jgi:hypothetical protein
MKVKISKVNMNLAGHFHVVVVAAAAALNRNGYGCIEAE